MAYRILVVEDDGLIRMDLVDMLQDMNFLVLDAANADEAMMILGAEPDINALLTDIDMPGSMNGLELAHQAAARWPDCKVAVISGRYNPTQGKMPDTALFVSKPVSEVTLAKALQTLGLLG